MSQFLTVEIVGSGGLEPPILAGQHWRPAQSGLLAPGLAGGIRRHEAQHLLLQLRIHLVSNRYNIEKQRFEVQTRHVFVQCRKNGDLQQTRLLYCHCHGVALLAPQISMDARSLRDRSL